MRGEGSELREDRCGRRDMVWLGRRDVVRKER